MKFESVNPKLLPLNEEVSRRMRCLSDRNNDSSESCPLRAQFLYSQTGADLLLCQHDPRTFSCSTFFPRGERRGFPLRQPFFQQPSPCTQCTFVRGQSCRCSNERETSPNCRGENGRAAPLSPKNTDPIVQMCGLEGNLHPKKEVTTFFFSGQRQEKR